MLISGDNFYRSFPALYPPRGSAYRDFDAWADTLDLLMSFGPDVLGPGHTKAVFGADTIKGALTDYRDAIRHIVDETRNGMDAGFTIDELAASVKLPDHLAEKPYLREYYGRVDFAVRAYFVGTLGWFDGNPTSLSPLAPKDEAAKIIALAGGAANVLAAAQKAHQDGDFQWALELADRLLNLGHEVALVTQLKVDALRAHAVAQINCPTRHYYIQSAKELEQGA